MEHHPVLGAFLFSLMAAQVQAQIIYTDVVPDAFFNVSGDTCHLDLNNDGTPDFDIRYWKLAGNGCTGCPPGAPVHPSYVQIDPLGTNSGAAYLNYAPAFAPLDVIDASLDWSSTPARIMASLGTHCAGPGTLQCAAYAQHQWGDGLSEDSLRYLGLRFDVGGATYYGWARGSIPYVSSPIVHSFTLKDYAYNSVPDEFILAGDSGASISTGITDILQHTVQVTPNPFSSTLTISIGAAPVHPITCTVHALTGEVFERRLVTSLNGRSSFTLDLASLAQGMYLLEVVIDGDRIVRKIMKE